MTADRRPPLPGLRISGTALMDAIVEMAHVRGWRAAHFRTSLNARGKYQTAVRYDGKGYPDLTLARRGRVLFVEVKGDGDTLRPDQKLWIAELAPAIADLASASHDVYVWTPVEWRDGTILRVLT